MIASNQLPVVHTYKLAAARIAINNSVHVHTFLLSPQ